MHFAQAHYDHRLRYWTMRTQFLLHLPELSSLHQVILRQEAGKSDQVQLLASQLRQLARPPNRRVARPRKSLVGQPEQIC